jgi:hypothetical protein
MNSSKIIWSLSQDSSVEPPQNKLQCSAALLFGMRLRRIYHHKFHVVGNKITYAIRNTKLKVKKYNFSIFCL